MNRNTLAFNKIPTPKTQDQILSEFILSFSPQAIQQKQPLKGADPKLLINNEASVPRQGEQVSEIVEETQAVAPVTPSVAPAAPAAPVIDENTVDFSSIQEMPMQQPVQQESQLRRLLTDPKTYETIANLGAAYSAYKGNVPLAETLSGIAGNIQTERVGREEAQRKALDPSRQILNMQRMAQAEKFEAEKQLAEKQAGQIGTQLFGEGFRNIEKDSVHKDILDDPLAKQIGIVSDRTIEEMPNLAGLTKETKDIKDYREQKNLAIKNFNNTLTDTKNIVKKTNNLLESDLSKLVGVKRFGPFNVEKKKLASVLGLSQSQMNDLINIENLSADKFRNLFTSLRSPKTGATGFGSLSQNELKVVSDMLISLNTAQSEEQFKEGLFTLRDYFEDRAIEKQNDIIRDYGSENIETYIPVAEQQVTENTDNSNLGSGFRIRGFK